MSGPTIRELLGGLSKTDVTLEQLEALASGKAVIVPVEPTEHMLDIGACYEDPDDLYSKHPLFDEGDFARDIYRAMIASRPKAGEGE